MNIFYNFIDALKNIQTETYTKKYDLDKRQKIFSGKI